MTKYGDEIVLINMSKLVKNKITIEDYLFAYLIYKGEKFELSVYADALEVSRADVIERLLQDGWVEPRDVDKEMNFTNLDPTQELMRMIEENVKSEAVEEWFGDWYNLWPTGIKSGGYYLRTDKKGTYRKMKQFVIEYPFYSKDLIMNATKNYLQEQSIIGYTHTKLSPYFISKDGMSVLAGECENINEAPEIDVNDYAGEEI